MFFKITSVAQQPDKLLEVSVSPFDGEGEAKSLSNIDCLLWAVGRDANVNDLQLDKTVSIVVVMTICNVYKVN